MSWSEFLVLLQGLMPETPLGNIVSIRSETDKDIIKHFTPEQKQIRQEWRSRRNQQVQHMDRASFDQAMKGFEAMFAGMNKKER